MNYVNRTLQLSMIAAPAPLPKIAQVARVRTRHRLVEDVSPSAAGSSVRLACVDDDTPGEILEVIWEAELDGQILDASAVLQRLQAAMAQDIRELLPQATTRSETAQVDAEKLFTKRGRIESEILRKTLDDQRRRVLLKYEATGDQQSILPGFSGDERRQRSADRRRWQRWLANDDLAPEPHRTAEFYRTRSFRLEPVGLAHLWPVAGQTRR